ncbi:MAG TPA: trypsin-like peptidase domain-containing protein [Thermoanaerobaculia bacterium]|nr:trypsin-like peptidase domain-containing protein [Thermoanaerobaculia bacterium]
MNNLADAIESAAKSIVRLERSSGIAWSHDIVITAAHGLRNDENLIGWDRSTDVAVLRASGLTPIEWNEVPQRVGNFAIVAGHSHRATFGIISAIDDYIEVDATLPPGFSGGPLIDLDGRAIGMNTSRVRRNGTTIPIATLRRVVASILEFGAVRRPFLGVGVHPVEGGMIVLSLAAEGPALKAGLLVGDVIKSPLHELLREEKIGSESTLHITRGGEPREVQITIGATT